MLEGLQLEERKRNCTTVGKILSWIKLDINSTTRGKVANIQLVFCSACEALLVSLSPFFLHIFSFVLLVCFSFFSRRTWPTRALFRKMQKEFQSCIVCTGKILKNTTTSSVFEAVLLV